MSTLQTLRSSKCSKTQTVDAVRQSQCPILVLTLFEHPLPCSCISRASLTARSRKRVAGKAMPFFCIFEIMSINSAATRAISSPLPQSIFVQSSFKTNTIYHSKNQYFEIYILFTLSSSKIHHNPSHLHPLAKWPLTHRE